MKRSFPALLGLLFATCASTPLFANFQFSATSGSQSFIVPTDGLYEITGFGAQGGSSTFAGGLGAEVDAFFNFTAGDVLTIDVGVAGGSTGSGGAGGGGGGGTFIVLNGTTLLVVAGGGGGGDLFATGIGGVTTQAGTSGTGAGGTSSAGAGGTGGTRGVADGGGGGGYNSNGGAGVGSASGAGGFDFFNGLAGGAGSVANDAGGYGGGGGGGGESGGGGGGYSGGGGGGFDGGNDGAGGGGGSFTDVSNINPTLIGAENSGDGFVDIQGPLTPEPASFGLIGIGLLGLLALRRRQR